MRSKRRVTLRIALCISSCSRSGADSGNFVFDQHIVTKVLSDVGPLFFLEDGEPFAGCLPREMAIAERPQDE
jgi:hypothetical protein